MEKAVPATERHPEKSKRGIYRILADYVRFWFRFVYPNRSLLEQGETRPVRELVVRQLDEFTGLPFESIWREQVWRLHRDGALDFRPRAAGSRWNDSDQIDVVAVGDDEILLGECRWSMNRVGVPLLDDLKRKGRMATSGGPWRRVRYALFSRSGFTPDLEAVAAAEGVLLADLEQLARAA